MAPPIDFPQDFSTKSTPIAGDLIIIADSEDLNLAKQVNIANLPVSSPTTTALNLKVDKIT